ncbi:hypothetical protein CBS101457_002558 [Exobasidium rhododendri]|nr:hypothetical protein CBS101457_002558 [Exobasidium rhododendri]
MASTSSLPTLLRKLNIGVASEEEGEPSASGSGTHNAPRLALTDQLHLLSAHIDTLEKSIEATVSSSESRDLISKQTFQAVNVQQKVSNVRDQVEALERHGKGEDVSGEVVLDTLAQYINAQRNLERQKRAYKVAVLMRDAVFALEALEGRLERSPLDAEDLASTIQEADDKASLLGIRGVHSRESTSKEGDDFRWVARSGSTPPAAMRELGSRLERAKEGVKQRLASAWSEHVVVRAEGGLMFLKIDETSLSQLLETLESRSELKALLEKLANDINHQILIPILKDRSSWVVQNESDGAWQVVRSDGEDKPCDCVAALIELLEYLPRRLLAAAPQASNSTFTFSKVFVPGILSPLLEYFKGTLPTRFDKPIASRVIPNLSQTSQGALKVYESLLQANFLQDGLRDEAQELYEWAQNIRKNYMKYLGIQLRRRARELLLREVGEGWQAVEIEVEIEVQIPQEIKEHLQQDQVSPSEANSTYAATKGNGGHGNGNGSGSGSGNRDRGNTPPSRKDETVRPSSSTELQRDLSSSGKSRQKRSALGGRRVVKPKDELGSGPLPDDEDGNDISWGFDDDVAADPSTSTSSGPDKAQYDALMESLDLEEDVDEDAWGLSEAEKVERAEKRASMRGDMAAAFQAYQNAQEKQHKSSLQQAAVAEGDEEEDDDDAWGLSTLETEAIERKRKSMLVERSTTMGPSRATVEDTAQPSHAQDGGDEDEDDAWGLSAQDGDAASRKRQSALTDRSAAPTISEKGHAPLGSNEDHAYLSNDDDDDDDDDDAWGLSKQEKEAISRKRQSILDNKVAVLTAPGGDTVQPSKKGQEHKEDDDNGEDEDAWGLSTQEIISISQKGQGGSVDKILAPNLSKRAETQIREEDRASLIPRKSVPSMLQAKEGCVISQRSASLISLIEEVLGDIEAIHSEGQSEALDIDYLIFALNDIMDMHRALLPVGHADTLANVPSLAMQFANDCSYIGKEFQRLQARWEPIQNQRQGGSSSHFVDFKMQAQLTLALGRRTFDSQLLLQHKMLMDCLIDADGFSRTYEDGRFQACQRSLKQVQFTLKQLQSAWKSVLTRSSFLSAMGKLVDGILCRVFMDIISLEDISEIESEKLANLLKSLGDLEHIFLDESKPESENSIVALFVPSWFKASYLAEILTGSLVDIEFLYFEAGALVDYTKAEVVSLIRSLFADTPKKKSTY